MPAAPRGTPGAPASSDLDLLARLQRLRIEVRVELLQRLLRDLHRDGDRVEAVPGLHRVGRPAGPHPPSLTPALALLRCELLGSVAAGGFLAAVAPTSGRADHEEDGHDDRDERYRREEPQRAA